MITEQEKTVLRHQAEKYIREELKMSDAQIDELGGIRKLTEMLAESAADRPLMRPGHVFDEAIRFYQEQKKPHEGK